MGNRTSGRITIPQNPTELLDLAQKIHEKHISDGENSPLHAMRHRNWADDGPKIADCRENHENAEIAARKANQLYRQRDITLDDIREIVQNSASLLKSIYAKNPKVLSDYGFEVIDSKTVKTDKKSEKS